MMPQACLFLSYVCVQTKIIIYPYTKRLIIFGAHSNTPVGTFHTSSVLQVFLIWRRWRLEGYIDIYYSKCTDSWFFWEAFWLQSSKRKEKRKASFGQGHDPKWRERKADKGKKGWWKGKTKLGLTAKDGALFRFVSVRKCYCSRKGEGKSHQMGVLNTLQ